jgi:mannan polymerase II complex MNN10 subunit
MHPYGVLRHSTDYLGSKIFVTICMFLLAGQLYFISHPPSHYPDRSFTDYRRPHRVASFVSHGDTQCLPQIKQEMVKESIAKHAVCRKHSPFATGRARIGLVTAQFGQQPDHYQKAFQTHLLHGLIHGTEVHVLCDPIVDDLWNKPAFILNLLMHEMLKPEQKRLEWLMWVDRDTLILDQCRPISSFLPPEPSRFGGWWDRSNSRHANSANKTHLLVSNDFNGLNNGVFLLRVNSWAIELFNAILAFRHFNPGVELVFTEQSAMEKVINEEDFKDHVQFVPQYWFNGYADGQPEQFRDRVDETGLEQMHVRRGDYLVHFAGRPGRQELINNWLDILKELPDIWEFGSVQRNISTEVTGFWKNLGYRGLSLG